MSKSHQRSHKKSRQRNATGFSVHPRGCETSAKTRTFCEVFGVPEAEAEALGLDASLRRLVRSWSTLSQPIKDAILLIVENGSSGD